jgi:hypothetical protein
MHEIWTCVPAALAVAAGSVPVSQLEAELLRPPALFQPPGYADVMAAAHAGVDPGVLLGARAVRPHAVRRGPELAPGRPHVTTMLLVATPVSCATHLVVECDGG